MILTKVPGLDTPKALARTNPVGLGKLSRYTAKNAPVLVVDEKTGKRWPIWVELDSNAAKPKHRLLEIHPSRNLLEGHTYVVVLRNLKRANGKRIDAGSAFAKLRAKPKPGARYAAIFKSLAKAKVKRDKSLAAGRSPQAEPSVGIPPIGVCPFGGSAIVYWDAGPARVTAPPLVNQPNRAQEDPHEYPRRTPAARQQKSDFLQPNGAVTDPCGGAPCVAAPDVG